MAPAPSVPASAASLGLRPRAGQRPPPTPVVRQWGLSAGPRGDWQGAHGSLKVGCGAWGQVAVPGEGFAVTLGVLVFYHCPDKLPQT